MESILGMLVDNIVGFEGGQMLNLPPSSILISGQEKRYVT